LQFSAGVVGSQRRSSLGKEDVAISGSRGMMEGRLAPSSLGARDFEGKVEPGRLIERL
jgi:hypothetical protein